MTEREAPQSSIVLYQTEDGRTRIECRLEDETIWLTQKLMAELFQKDVRTIDEHHGHIFAEGELAAEATIRKLRMVRLEGRREVAHILCETDRGRTVRKLRMVRSERERDVIGHNGAAR